MPKTYQRKTPNPADTRPPVVNPLPEMCKMMGLSPTAASRLARVPFSAARQALAEKPCGAIEAYLRLQAALGIYPRLKRVEALKVWIDLDHVDRLYFDNTFRASMKLAPLPSTKLELRQLIFSLRKRNSYYKITHYFQKALICTIEGHPVWRRGQVGQYLKAQRKVNADDDEKLMPGKEMLNRWRDLLIEQVLLACSGYDAMFRFRYGLQQSIEGSRLYITSTKVITDKPKMWFIQRLGYIAWLNGAWGEVEISSEPAPANSEEATG